MARRKPPPYIPPAESRPPNPPPPGFFDCGCCGKRKPVDEREPHLPPEWVRCVGCHLLSERHNPYRDVTEPGPGGRRVWSVVDEWRRQNPEAAGVPD